MTIHFSIFDITSKKDIKTAISASRDKMLKIDFDTGKTIYCNRSEMSDSEIVTKIYDYIRRTQNELSEAMNTPEPTDEDLNAMYADMCRQYENMRQNQYDAEAAILHHYA